MKTPSGLTIGEVNVPIFGNIGPIQVLPNDSLPSGTVWVPQGDGTYEFPLGGKAGWWAAAPTAALKIPGWLGGSETVLSVPIGAAGVELPLGLAKAGVLGANVLLPTQNGVYSPIGLTMTNVNTILPIGFTNINVTTGNYIGTNGINVNNGQNLLLLQNPLGVPLPLLYGLGGFNFGVEGAGLTSPSLFGIKLFSDDLLQLGTQTGPNTSAGLIPPGFLPTDPLSQIVTGVTAPFGVGSLTQILGLDTVIKPVMTAFGPVYQVFSAIALKPLSDFATQQYGPFVNGSASSILDLSKTLADGAAQLPGADSSSSDAATTAKTTTVTEKVGAHSLESGGEPFSALAERLSAPATAPADAPTKPDTVESAADPVVTIPAPSTTTAPEAVTPEPITPEPTTPAPTMPEPESTPEPAPSQENPVTSEPAAEEPSAPAEAATAEDSAPSTTATDTEDSTPTEQSEGTAPAEPAAA
ncbi:hypothetical protein [Tsukamurella sp. 1534]|uniref:hypothetical protein n=1 Tax=Tsukamurella sp. 1534 TaxID=1151061 RepID=UPI0006ACB96D|nr:hypothetical protein [Tsukamurella sp. 1534]